MWSIDQAAAWMRLSDGDSIEAFAISVVVWPLVSANLELRLKLGEGL